MIDKHTRDAFTTDTFHRLLVEAARVWVIECYLRTGELPEPETRYIYANGPVGIDWGNEAGPDDPKQKPLRRKRICVSIYIEDQAQ